jgi:hypothetical protein
MTEHVTVPGRRLGRRTPKRAAALRLGPLLTGSVPAHPPAADHFAAVHDWGLYRNDTYGDCGPTSVANDRKLVTRYLTGAESSPSQADVFDLYRRSGNPDFDPNNPGGPGDGGVDMQTMCEALVAGGIGGRRALAFAQVDTSSPDEAKAAISIFGSLLLGVTLQAAQQTQTDNGLWDYQRSPVWGGHAVLAGRYGVSGSGADIAVITWGEVVSTTDAFWEHQVEEAWVVIWPEHLGTTEFQQGVDLAQLAADYEALTGHEFPGQPQPSPGPVPVPAPPVVDPADRALVAALVPWLNERHSGENRRAAIAVRTWMATKGL